MDSCLGFWAIMQWLIGRATCKRSGWYKWPQQAFLAHLQFNFSKTIQMCWGFFKVKMSWGGLLSLTEQFQCGTAGAQGCSVSSPSAPQGRHLQLEEVSHPWFPRRWGTALLMFLTASRCFSSHLGWCWPWATCACCHERFMVSKGEYQSHCVKLHPSCSQGLPQHPSEHVCWGKTILFCPISVQAAEKCSNK